MQTEPDVTHTPAAPWPVMVLAYNEERHIVACLDSIFAADPECKLEVFVMANGCTDRTEDIVTAYARNRPEVHLVSLVLGDKCNAWNVFVHDTVPARCPGREIYFFADGDARVVRGSFSAMARGLIGHAHAHAASQCRHRDAMQNTIGTKSSRSMGSSQTCIHFEAALSIGSARYRFASRSNSKVTMA